jgi:molybdopterin molybdotransferase
MLSVRDAQEQLLARVTTPLSPELLPLARGLGRVLAEDLRAPCDVPAGDNSAVDGYAVASADLPGDGVRDLEVVADLAAGSVYEQALRIGQALAIMTGAPMPPGADTVIPLERAERLGPRVRIGRSAKGANVRLRGEDVREGAVVVEAGAVLRPQELGLIAALGFPQVLVRRRAQVALLSTGDEVAEPGYPRRPGQIYDANRFMLRAAIEQCGGEVTDFGIVPDTCEALRARLLAASQTADVVMTSGGVSVGGYDLVKDVLRDVGVIDFWQVAMQPGRPLAAGTIGGAHFFGLPGNPVASMLTFTVFVRPVLQKLAGRRHVEPRGFQARTAEPMPKKVGRREYKRGVVTYREGGFEVRTTGPQGSGIISSMVAGNCLIVLEEERGDVRAGEPVWVEPFGED